MRTVSTLAGAVAAGAALLAAPAAHAATPAASAACTAAVDAANKAEAAFQAALADYNQEIAAGGHPGSAEQANLDSLKNAASLATSDSVRVCGATGSPVGTMTTGTGSTSTGHVGLDLAAGVGLVGAAGLTVALRRRTRGGDQA